jgi:subtilisin family serine protease
MIMRNTTRNPLKILATLCIFMAGPVYAREAVVKSSVAEPVVEKREQPSANQVKVSITRLSGGKQSIGQLRASFDAGDLYETPKGTRRLLRLAGALAIRSASLSEADSLIQRITKVGAALQHQEAKRETGGWVVFTAPEQERERQIRTKGTLGEVVAQLRGQLNEVVNPVFVDPDSGLRLVATEGVVIRLKHGVDPATYFGAQESAVRPLPGTTDQFVLELSGYTAEQIFADVNSRMADPRILWAEPDFLMEVVRQYTPNDTYYSSQWHLHNTGQGGGTSDADIDAPEAWDMTRGSNTVVIAVFDDSVETTHPDLRSSIYTNNSDLVDGIDNDNNGYLDDYTGWDFYFNDNNPNPSNVDDTHGTPCAGVAAAAGHNAAGVAGVAFGCRILPIKVYDGNYLADSALLANALRYAAGLTTPQPWRGADVISISLTFAQSSTFDSALVDAATNGRGGKGCAIFAAAGNDASGYAKYILSGITAGSHTYKWQYQKDNVDSAGSDTVWLDGVVFPGGGTESFEGGGLPSGWTTGGYSSWYNVQEGVSGDHALTGWNGPNSRALRAGTITHSKTNYVQVTKNTGAGAVTFYMWVSCEYGVDYYYDFASFFLDGTRYFMADGDFTPDISPGYPASHSNTIAVGASTDFDFRSDYSQYGEGLDIVLPSSGGRSGIYTTDRTGTNGYASGDYDSDFGGTSSATPLAAGIGALVLSKNPTLTSAEVRTILHKSCDKIGGTSILYTGGDDGAGGTNTFYGYGKLNAYRALTNTALALPNKATSPSPADLEMGVATNAQLSWTAVPNAPGYRVNFGTSATPLFVRNQAGTTFSTNMAPNTTYYWRIDPTNASGVTTGDVWRFTTVAIAALAISPSSTNVSSSTAGGLIIGVTANVAWTAVSNAAWIAVTGGSPGTNNGTVTFSVATNAGTTARTGGVVVAGGGLIRTCAVVQAGAAAVLGINPTGTNFTSAAWSGRTIAVTANVAWTATSNAAWIAVTGGSPGTNNGTVTFSVATNAETTARTGGVVVAGGGLTRTCAVVQAGAVTQRIIGVSGNLAFGNVVTGRTATATLTLTNSGNSTLIVTNIGYSNRFTGAWSGSIAAGKSTNVTVSFAPVALTAYQCTVIVNSDKTSGENTINASGTGTIWRPEALDDANFGVMSNRFGFNMNWVSGRVVVVDACTNLVNPGWMPLQTNTLSNTPSYFIDPHWTNYIGRFYRIRAP